MFKYTENPEAVKRTLKKLAITALLCAPILIFLFTFAFTNRNHVLYGDWDYFAQLYEAARRSILEFNQFPWWNPWVVGGIPLYANPQFGLFSIQMPLVLLFGTVKGLHLAVVVYYILGFWGMYFLLRRLRPQAKVMGILLSYIWIFSSFPAWHIAGGHLTFASYLLAPWLFLALLRLRSKWGWLWLGLIVAFLINQSLHYMVIQMFFVAGLYVVYELFRRWRQHDLSLWQMFKPYLLALAVALPLSLHKLYYTLTYIGDYTRIPAPEGENSIAALTAALSFRQPIDPVQTFHSQFGWSEYSAYFGILSLALIAYLIFRCCERGKINRRQIGLLAAMALFLLIAAGPFSDFSPYSLLKELPVFEQMQVASRWLAWFVLASILFLVMLPKKTFVYVVLVFSLLDVFVVNRMIMSYEQPAYQPPAKAAAEFDQQAYYQNQPAIDRSSFRFLHATQSNVGDTFGYEPLAEFSIVADKEFSKGLTIRCGSNLSDDCPFVLSKNATVSHWTPQSMTLKRTDDGPVELNMNPGKHWYANGKQLFPNMREFETKQRFVISDNTSEIKLEYRP